MRPEPQKLRTWKSRGQKISYAPQHDLYIVDNPDGTFHSIKSNQEIMLKSHPVDPEPKKKVPSKPK